MRTKKALKNIAWAYGSRVVNILFLIFLVPELLRALGKEGFGFYQVLLQTVGYFSLLDLGLGTSFIYSLYKPLAEEDYDRVNRLASGGFRLFAGLGLAVLLISAGGAFFAKTLLNVSELSRAEAGWAFFLMAASTAVTYLFGLPLQVMEANQQAYKVSFYYLFNSALSILVALLLVYAGWGMIGVSGGYFLVNLLSYGVVFVRIRMLYRWLRLFDRPAYDFKTNTLYVFIDKLVGMGVMRSDYIVLSLLISPAVVAIYSLYTIFFQQVVGLMQMSFRPLQHGIGNLFNADSETGPSKLLQLWKELYFLTGLISLVFLGGVAAVFKPFYQLWTNGEEMLPEYSLYFFMIFFLHLMVQKPTLSVINGLGLYRERVPGMLIELTVNLGLTFLLVPVLQSAGAIMGTAGGFLCGTFWFWPYIMFRKIGYSLLTYWRMVAMIWPVVALNVLLQTWLSDFLAGLDWGRWLWFLGGGAGSLLISGVVILVAYGWTDQFRQVVQRVRHTLQVARS